jgi:anti-anti-sigma factor
VWGEIGQRVEAGQTGRPIPVDGNCRDHGYVELVDTRAEMLALGDEALVVVRGDLDLFSVHVLEDALADVPPVSRVVIDVEGVSFLDYAVLRRIEVAARAFAADGRSLRLDHASGMVRRLIEIMRLDDLRVR